jgi:polyhydroxybutyrate depolymerase
MSRHRRRRRRLAALAITAAALAAPGSAHADPAPIECDTTGGAYAVGVNCRQIEVDGAQRRFIAYVPATRPVTGARRPVVFMHHGSSGTGGRFLRISGWREQADATGLVAVFPTGLRYRILENGRRSTKWNDGHLADLIDLDERPRGYPDDAPFPADDVGFTDAILAELDAHLPIDRRRVYASGFSNGADFTAHLAVERSTVFAAAAFSAGGLQEPGTPERPIPMTMSVGTRDDRILALTGLPELPLDPVDVLTQPVLDAAIERHLATLGLDPARYGASTDGRHTELRWPAADPAFRFLLLGGLGHKYPNGRNNPGGFAAAPEFWRFFAAHPLVSQERGLPRQ